MGRSWVSVVWPVGSIALAFRNPPATGRAKVAFTRAGCGGSASGIDCAPLLFLFGLPIVPVTWKRKTCPSNLSVIGREETARVSVAPSLGLVRRGTPAEVAGWSSLVHSTVLVLVSTNFR